MTYADLFAGVSEIVTRIIEDVDKDPGRWLDLVSHIDSLPADDRDRLLTAFEALDPDSLGDPRRQDAWRAPVHIAPGHRWRRMGDSNSRGVAPNTLSKRAP
jgi:hypothetical protein